MQCVVGASCLLIGAYSLYWHGWIYPLEAQPFYLVRSSWHTGVNRDRIRTCASRGLFLPKSYSAACGCRHVAVRVACLGRVWLPRQPPWFSSQHGRCRPRPGQPAAPARWVQHCGQLRLAAPQGLSRRCPPSAAFETCPRNAALRSPGLAPACLKQAAAPAGNECTRAADLPARMPTRAAGETQRYLYEQDLILFCLWECPCP